MFNLFINYVKEVLEARVKERTNCGKVRIEIRTVLKNNGKELYGMVVFMEGKNYAPTIYLDPYFEEYKEGKELEEIMENITDMVINSISMPKKYNEVISDITDFEAVKERIIVSVVNTAHNEKMLAEVPHKEVLDLSFIYKILINTNESGAASINIKNEFMKLWGISIEELHEAAIKNTKRLLPPRVKTMAETLKEIFIKEGMSKEMADMIIDYQSFSNEPQMYVVSNKESMYGAVYMFDTEVLSKLSKELGTNLFILPSSVHEIIVVSTDAGSSTELADMVKQINIDEVPLEDCLSDSVYYYNPYTNKVLIANGSYKTKF